MRSLFLKGALLRNGRSSRGHELGTAAERAHLVDNAVAGDDGGEARRVDALVAASNGLRRAGAEANEAAVAFLRVGPFALAFTVAAALLPHQRRRRQSSGDIADFSDSSDDDAEQLIVHHRARRTQRAVPREEAVAVVARQLVAVVAEAAAGGPAAAHTAGAKIVVAGAGGGLHRRWCGGRVRLRRNNF